MVRLVRGASRRRGCGGGGVGVGVVTLMALVVPAVTGVGAIEAKCSACRCMMKTMFERLEEEGPELDLDFSRNRVGEDGKGTGKVVSYARSETRVETVLDGLCKSLTRYGLARGPDHVRMAQEARKRVAGSDRGRAAVKEARRVLDVEEAQDREARGESLSEEEVEAAEAARKAEEDAKEHRKARRKAEAEAEDRELLKKPAEWIEDFGSEKKVENVHNQKVMAQFCAVMLDEHEDAIAEAIWAQPTPAPSEAGPPFVEGLCASVCADEAAEEQRRSSHQEL